MLYVCTVIDDKIGVMDTKEKKLYFYTEDELKFAMQFNLNIDGVFVERSHLKILLTHPEYVLLHTEYENFGNTEKYTYTISVDKDKAVDYTISSTGNSFLNKYFNMYVYNTVTKDRLYSDFPFDKDLCEYIAKTIFQTEIGSF